MMADLKSRIGKRKLFSNRVWKREDQLGHSGQHKRATSVSYNSRRDENAPVDYDSDASSIASGMDQGEEDYFLPSQGGEGGEAPTTPSRKGQSAEPTSLLKRIDLAVFPASSPTRRAYGAEESPKRLIERIGNGLYAAQHPPMTLGSEDMEIDSTPGQGGPIAEEAPNGHVWTDQAVHEAGAMSGINSLAIDKVYHEAGSGTIQSASTTSLNNRFEQSHDHHQPTNEGSTTNKNIETIPGLTLSGHLHHLKSPVQHHNAEAYSSSSSSLPVPATEGGSHEKTTNSVMISQTPPRTSTRKSPPSSLEEGQWEEVNASSQMPPDFIENVRKLLLPLITQNAQHRTDFGQETIQSPDSVQKALSGVVDQGACTSFVRQMNIVRREMIALKPETVKEVAIPTTIDRSQVAREECSSIPSQPLSPEKNDRPTPWAPRAMREVPLPMKRDGPNKPPPTKTSSYVDNFNAEGKNKAEVPTANGSDYPEQLKPRDKVDETSRYPQLKEIRDRRAGYESRRSSYTPIAYRRDSLDSRGEPRRTLDRDYAPSSYRKDSLDLQVEARRPSVRDFASNHRRTDSLENPPAPLRTPIRSSFKDRGNWIESNLSSDGIDRTKRPYPLSDHRTSHSSTTATRRSLSRSPPRRRSRSPRYSRSHTRQDKAQSPPRRYSPAAPHSAQKQEFTSRRPHSPARNGRSPSPAENILLRIRRGRSRSRSPISRYEKGLSPTRKDHYTSRHRSPYYGRDHSLGGPPRRSSRKSYSPIHRSKSPPMRRRTPTDQRLDKTPRESRSPIRRRHHSPYALMEIDLRSPSRSRSRSFSRSHSLPTKQHRLPKPRPASTINGPEYDLPRSAYDEPNEEERKSHVNNLNQTTSIDPRPTSPALSNPCHNVPGLWFVKMGSNAADILECYFEVDKETAVKWGIPEVSSSLEKRVLPSHMDKPRLSLQILCLPADLVQSVTAKLPPDASAEAVASALSTIQGSWPPIGNLIIEVNPGTSQAHTWLPYNLQPISPPVTLEDYIHEGRNVVRLIQLAGMADHIFVLYAFLQQPDPPPLLKFPHDLDKSLAHTKFKLGDVGSIPLLVTSVSIVPLDSISPNS